MYTITVQDVESVVAELTGQSGARDGFLYALLRKTVFLSVRGKCRSTPCLYGKGLEEDILHDIYIKVWTHAYRILFTDEGVNTDPFGFTKWLSAVSNNCVRDYVRTLSRREAHLVSPKARQEEDEDGEQDLLESIAAPTSEAEKREEREEREERLARILCRMLSEDFSVHIRLAWFAHSLCVIAAGEKKHLAAGLTAERYAQMTLSTMYEDLLARSRGLSWLKVTEEAERGVREGLSRRICNREYGELPLGAFFMKKGGKASVSDWVGRVNERARRIFGKD